MKKVITFCLTLGFVVLSGVSAFAQDFIGYSSSNYAGVNSVYSNPASIAGSYYQWGFNLFGISTRVGNNMVPLTKSDIFNFNADSLKNQLLSGDMNTLSGIANVTVNGPSLMFALNEKSAIAITTRSHVLVNVENIDTKLASQIMNTTVNNIGSSYTIASSQNMQVDFNAYTELGLTYARVIYTQGSHLVKGGITVKYLIGTANGYLTVNNLHATLKVDRNKTIKTRSLQSYLTDARGKIAVGLGGVQISDFKPRDLLEVRNTGFGADIGFIYQYRPHHTGSGYMPNNYKLKVGLSLLDVGGIRFKRNIDKSGGYRIQIADGQRFYLSKLSDTDIDHIKKTLEQYPQYFTQKNNAQSATYWVSLPTSLHLAVDYHLHNNFYLNMSARTALSLFKEGVGSGTTYNYITLTPRFETNFFGFFVPLSYSSLTSFNAGIALRLGPLYIGSGSILTTVIGETKQAGVYVGLHING